MAKAIGVILAFCLWLPAGGPNLSFAAREGSFPRPVNLEPNIAFWKKVFVEWGERDHVIHDRDYLDVVYEVLQAAPQFPKRKGKGKGRGAPDPMRLRTAHFAALLARLEAEGPEGLGEEGGRVYTLWNCPCAPGTLSAAAGRVRVQRGIREPFAAALQRAERIRHQILPVLHRHDLPDELMAIPLIESGFENRAVSRAKAVGMWQFIRSTARIFGLTVRGRRDDRRDPHRSTLAAARMLQHHYAELGSWPLAITAYNHGLEGVRRAVGVVGTDDIGRIVAEYRGPRFGFASRNFYAEFLAAVDILDLHLTQLED